MKKNIQYIAALIVIFGGIVVSLRFPYKAFGAIYIGFILLLGYFITLQKRKKKRKTKIFIIACLSFLILVMIGFLLTSPGSYYARIIIIGTVTPIPTSTNTLIPTNTEIATGINTLTPIAPPQFHDVQNNHPDYDDIMFLYENGYIVGCSIPGMFCPEDELLRAEAAVLGLRLYYGTDYNKIKPTKTVFNDIPVSPNEKWYSGWVEEAYLTELLFPCEEEPELMICPLDPLTRLEGAILIMKLFSFINLEYGINNEKFNINNYEFKNIFVDVQSNIEEALWIEAAFQMGFIDSCLETDGQMKFCPEESLKRSDAARWMARILRYHLSLQSLDAAATATEACIDFESEYPGTPCP